MINPKNLSRGSIWLVNLNPTVGHEQAKTRPCLVMSADRYNHSRAGMAVVIPLTSQDHDFPWYVAVDEAEGKLHKKSYAICDQIRSVSLDRFSPKCLGFVNDYTMGLIEEKVAALLDLFLR